MEAEQELQVNSGIVNRGLSKMMPGKFGAIERETPRQEKVEGKMHERLESKAYEKKEHQIMKKMTCKNCKLETAAGKYCVHCGSPQ